MCSCNTCRLAATRRRVVLAPAEIAAADAIEHERCAEDIAAHCAPAYRADHSTLTGRLAIGIQGARCEAALAKYLGVSHIKGTPGAPDVAGYDVRGTQYLDGRLILHPRDLDERIYVLVVGPLTARHLAPRPYHLAFFVCGWIYGRAGKDKQWWDEPIGNGRPAFFVPQQALMPIQSLPPLLTEGHKGGT